MRTTKKRPIMAEMMRRKQWERKSTRRKLPRLDQEVALAVEVDKVPEVEAALDREVAPAAALEVARDREVVLVPAAPNPSLRRAKERKSTKRILPRPAPAVVAVPEVEVALDREVAPAVEADQAVAPQLLLRSRLRRSQRRRAKARRSKVSGALTTPHIFLMGIPR